MSVRRKYVPPNRVARHLHDAGGVTEATALARAAAGIDAIRDEVAASIDAKIEALTQDAGGRDAASLGRIYRLADEIFAEAGAIALSEVSETAWSLCALIAAHDPAPPPQVAVMAHAQTLRALRRPELAGAPEVRAEVLAALKTLSE